MDVSSPATSKIEFLSGRNHSLTLSFPILLSDLYETMARKEKRFSPGRNDHNQPNVSSAQTGDGTERGTRRAYLFSDSGRSGYGSAFKSRSVGRGAFGDCPIRFLCSTSFRPLS